jgi:predicted nucleic acid-binding protein
VLDAWALLALVRDEVAAARVEAKIDEGDVLMSAINLGEAYYRTTRRQGMERAESVVSDARRSMTVDVPDWPLVLAAARLKSAHQLSYADAFCVATAQRHRAPVWTGDPEILALGDLVDAVDLRPGAVP